MLAQNYSIKMLFYVLFKLLNPIKPGFMKCEHLPFHLARTTLIWHKAVVPSNLKQSVLYAEESQGVERM